MRVCLVVATLAFLGMQPALAADAKPSEESVRHLFEVMQTSQMIDMVMAQMDANLREGLERATGGRTLNAEQQKLHDDMRAKIEAMLKDELNWARLEPQMVEVYRSTFTPAEIDGMVKFYSSPSGKAVVAKLPQATHQMMQLTQERVRTLVPRIVELQKETAQKIRDAATAPAAAPAPGEPPSPQAPPSH
jgi:hypothetical protein